MPINKIVGIATIALAGAGVGILIYSFFGWICGVSICFILVLSWAFDNFIDPVVLEEGLSLLRGVSNQPWVPYAYSIVLQIGFVYAVGNLTTFHIINFFKSARNFGIDVRALWLKFCRGENLMFCIYEAMVFFLPVLNLMLLVYLSYLYFFSGISSDIILARRFTRWLLLILPTLNGFFYVTSISAFPYYWFDLWAYNSWDNERRRALFWFAIFIVVAAGLYIAYRLKLLFFYIVTVTLLFCMFLCKLGKRLREIDSLRRVLGSLCGVPTYSNLKFGGFGKPLFLVFKRSMKGLRKFFDFEPSIPEIVVPTSPPDFGKTLVTNLKSDPDIPVEWLKNGHTIPENMKDTAKIARDVYVAQVDVLDKNMSPVGTPQNLIENQYRVRLVKGIDALGTLTEASTSTERSPMEISVRMGLSELQKNGKFAAETAVGGGGTAGKLIFAGVALTGAAGKTVYDVYHAGIAAGKASATASATGGVDEKKNK